MNRKRIPPLERFWRSVDKSGECWTWTKCLDSAGYGQFYDGKNVVRASRYIFQVLNGQLSSDQLVCHHCDNPACVRPEHLFEGSHGDNMRDAARKGRLVYGQNKGELNGSAKLTTDDVIRIRSEEWRQISSSELGRRLNVSVGLISGIRLRKWWKHVGLEATKEGQTK